MPTRFPLKAQEGVVAISWDEKVRGGAGFGGDKN